MKNISDNSVDLVLTDPPYNIGIAEWDKINDYIKWCISWLKECQRVLKPTGVLYFWHNDMKKIAELLQAIQENTNFEFISFCIWDKGDTYRAQTWKNRRPDSKNTLRAWFNICEYCLHFFNVSQDDVRNRPHTRANRIYSNANNFREIKDWYAAEKKRLANY